MKSPARLWAKSRLSTSFRSDSSPAQASSRNADRPGSSCSRATSRILSICCQRSGSIALLLAQLAIKPGFGLVPLPNHGNPGYFEHFCCLLHG